MHNSIPSSTHRFRLSPRDSLLINIGFSWIAWNYQFWADNHVFINGRPDRRWLPHVDRGVFSRDLMDGIIALHTQIVSLKAGGRLRVSSSFDFAACALAVRVAITSHRHGHTNIKLASIDKLSKRLLRRLENARKRAKRAQIRRSGQVWIYERGRLLEGIHPLAEDRLP